MKRNTTLAALAAACLSAIFLSASPAVAADADAIEAGAPAVPAATYALKYKFHPDETIRTKVVHHAEVETTVSGTSQTAHTSSSSIKAWHVTDVDAEGQMTFEHRVESIDMRTALSGRAEVHYDSQTDKKPPLGYEDAAKAVGVTLTIVTIDPQGKIVKRLDKHVQPAANSSGGRIVMPLPAEPIAVGGVWTAPRDFDVVLEGGLTKKIKARERYELEQVQNGVATIGVETQVLTPNNEPKIRAQMIQALLKGKVRFDIATGRVISEQLDSDENVLSFAGVDSSIHYVTHLTEEILPGGNNIAAGPKATEAKRVTPGRTPTIR